jgi:WD40 repeat protein
MRFWTKLVFLVASSGLLIGLMLPPLQLGLKQVIPEPAAHAPQHPIPERDSIHPRGVYALAFSPDGKALASGGGGGEIALWDVATRVRQSRFADQASRITALAFAPDGRFLAAGTEEGSVHVWDLAQGLEMVTPRGHAGPVVAIAFTARSNDLVSCGLDASVRCWQTGSGKEQASFALPQELRSAALSPNGQLIAWWTQQEIGSPWDGATTCVGLLELPAGKRQTSLARTDSGGLIRPVAISADALVLASGGFDVAHACHGIRLWDAGSLRPRGFLPFRKSFPISLAFGQGSHIIAAGGNDSLIRIWDLATGEELAAISGHPGPVTCLAFTLDGKTLVSANGGRNLREQPVPGQVMWWDVPTSRNGDVGPVATPNRSRAPAT